MRNRLYLTQTDTTVGFVSQDATKIDRAKERLPNKHYIRTVNSLETLKALTRVPQSHKNRLRRAKRTTFVLPNGQSFRVVKGGRHALLLDRVGWFYSSSANQSGEEYNRDYAQSQAEVWVAPLDDDKAIGTPSSIYRLGINRLWKIR